MPRMLGTRSRPQGQYNRDNLRRAYDATRGGMSVYKAARIYKVPESTLRDRTRGNVSIDTERPGPDGVLAHEEENELVDHIKYMAQIGYGYSKRDIQYMARDYAISIGTSVKCQSCMSNNWFYSFIKRWPELKVATPQKLSIARAKAATTQTIESYFSELADILKKYDLEKHPQNIFNVDETGVSTEHVPSKIVCGKDTQAQSITSPRSSNVTIIAGGNALGNHVPPYYVFPGQRWNNDLLDGAAVGAGGEMSKNGWSNSTVFTNYLTKHFVKYATLSQQAEGPKTLILYDGHRSHCLLTLKQWADKHNVVLFVLPPHSSHLTQPLDVGVFGPFKKLFSRECQNYMRNNPGLSITKYNVAELTAGPYVKALSTENLASAFRRAGIFPFNSQAITPAQLAPASIYVRQRDDEPVTVEPVQDPEPTAQDPEHEEQAQDLQATEPVQDPEPLLDENIATLTSDSHTTENNNTDTPVILSTNDIYQTPSNFFDSRTIKTALVRKPKRKFVPPFIAGSLLKKENVEIMELSAAKKINTENKTKSNSNVITSNNGNVHKGQVSKGQVSKGQVSTGQVSKGRASNGRVSKGKGQVSKGRVSKGRVSKGQVSKRKTSTEKVSKGMPKASTSGERMNEDGCSMSDCESVDESELCCVCHDWQPVQLRGCQSVVFVKWGQCEICGHWTHLTYCSTVTVLRLASVFRCPHCLID